MTGGRPSRRMPCPLASAPADAPLASDASAFLALRGQDVAVTGVGLASTQVGVQGRWLVRLDLVLLHPAPDVADEVLDALAATTTGPTRARIAAAARAFERASRTRAGPALGRGQDGAATAMVLSALILLARRPRPPAALRAAPASHLRHRRREADGHLARAGRPPPRARRRPARGPPERRRAGPDRTRLACPGRHHRPRRPGTADAPGRRPARTAQRPVRQRPSAVAPARPPASRSKERCRSRAAHPALRGSGTAGRSVGGWPAQGGADRGGEVAVLVSWGEVEDGRVPDAGVDRGADRGRSAIDALLGGGTCWRASSAETPRILPNPHRRGVL